MSENKRYKKEKSAEDMWIVQHEKEAIEKMRAEKEVKMADAARARGVDELESLREAHLLKCPQCGHDMVQSVIEEVSVIQCSFCEGIYFGQDQFQAFVEHHDEHKKGVIRHLFGLK
ncbi:MAG: rubrerythrin [Candidatus Latescibacterota bacterium]|jgi:rubrerythrin